MQAGGGGQKIAKFHFFKTDEQLKEIMQSCTMYRFWKEISLEKVWTVVS